MEEYHFVAKAETIEGETIYIVSNVFKNIQDLTLQKGRANNLVLSNACLNSQIEWNDDYFNRLKTALNGQKTDAFFSFKPSQIIGDSSHTLNVHHIVGTKVKRLFKITLKKTEEQEKLLKTFADKLTIIKEENIQREKDCVKKFALLLNEKKKHLRDLSKLSPQEYTSISNQIAALSLKSCQNRIFSKSEEASLQNQFISQVNSLEPFIPPTNSSLFEPSLAFRQYNEKIEQKDISLNTKNLKTAIKQEENPSKVKRQSANGYYINPKIELEISEEKRKSFREMLKNAQQKTIVVVEDENSQNKPQGLTQNQHQASLIKLKKEQQQFDQLLKREELDHAFLEPLDEKKIIYIKSRRIYWEEQQQDLNGFQKTARQESCDLFEDDEQEISDQL